MRFVLLIAAFLALHPWLGHAVADDPCGGIGKKSRPGHH
jgi:hypothetical protein